MIKDKFTLVILSSDCYFGPDFGSGHKLGDVLVVACCLLFVGARGEGCCDEFHSFRPLQHSFSVHLHFILRFRSIQ